MPEPDGILAQAALATVNHLLRDAGWARQRLSPLAGRSARLLVGSGAQPFRLDFGIDAAGLLCQAEAGEPDVEIEWPDDAPLRLLLCGRDKLLQNVRLRGDAELAEALRFVLPRLRWDAEEDLAKRVGDIAAHRLVGSFRGLLAWQRDAARRLAENAAEYFGEEQSLLATRTQHSADTQSLADLGAALERLELRLQRLEASAPGAGTATASPPKAL